MNERIKELAVQAGAGEWGDSVVPAMMNIEKFAQSIVNECCQMMIDMEIKYPANLTVREIKKHFGV
jgi:hypothetical protein